MNPIQFNYSWQPTYHAAVCEMEDNRMMGRIFEARAAMEQRLLSPITQDCQEFREFAVAQNILEALTCEWVDNNARPQTII